MKLSQVLAWGFVAFQSVAQAALPLNPLDPSLPLTTHTRVECLLENAVVNTGATQAACSERHSDGTHAESTGVASASLHTGELRVVAGSQSPPRPSLQGPGYGWAEASMYDTLTVAGPVTNGFRVNLSMSVGGFYSASAGTPVPLTDTFINASLLTSSAETGLPVDSSQIIVKLLSSQAQGTPVTAFRESESGDLTTNGVVPVGNPTSLLFDPADMRFTLTSSFDITPSKPSFAFSARLLIGNFSTFADGSGGGDTVLDFGRTAKLSIDAPPGVAFVSGSGAFLVPVPEPANAALLAIGLVALFLARHRAADRSRSS